MRKNQLCGIAAALAVIALVFGLVACSGGSTSGGLSAGGETSEPATLGDVMSIDADSTQWAYDSETFVYVYEVDGVPTRVSAKLPADVLVDMDAVDVSAEDHNEQIIELVSDLPIDAVEDLSVGILSEEELAAYVGMTGQDLIDAGFEITGWWIDDDVTSYYLVNGLYEYTFTFNETIGEEEVSAMSFNAYDAMLPLTVSGAEYDCLSWNATDLSVTP